MTKRYRDPADIAPIDATQELLLAIYDAVAGLRADLRAGAEARVTSDAAAGGPAKPSAPAAAPRAKRQPAKKRVTTRKKA